MASRSLVSLGDDRIAYLDRLAKQRGQSRSALVREAVDKLIAESPLDEGEDLARRNAALEAGFGLWKGRTDIGDAVEWQRRERASWTRPWDDDYKETRAEFPDLFSAEEDREWAYWRAQEPSNAGRSIEDIVKDLDKP